MSVDTHVAFQVRLPDGTLGFAALNGCQSTTCDVQTSDGYDRGSFYLRFVSATADNGDAINGKDTMAIQFVPSMVNGPSGVVGLAPAGGLADYRFTYDSSKQHGTEYGATGSFDVTATPIDGTVDQCYPCGTTSGATATSPTPTPTPTPTPNPTPTNGSTGTTSNTSTGTGTNTSSGSNTSTGTTSNTSTGSGPPTSSGTS